MRLSDPQHNLGVEEDERQEGQGSCHQDVVPIGRESDPINVQVELRRPVSAFSVALEFHETGDFQAHREGRHRQHVIRGSQARTERMADCLSKET